MGLTFQLWHDVERNTASTYVLQTYYGANYALHHEGAWVERMYSPYSFLTTALDGVSGQHHSPAAL
jgi:hypothetical protein